MRICMIGTGYVGLVSGTCFSEFGFTVDCIDVDQSKVDLLQNGNIPIFEPELESLVRKNVKANRLFFSTDLNQAIARADIIFLAVGTPSDDITGEADLSYLFAAVDQIILNLRRATPIVIKSTVPVGTCRKVQNYIKKRFNFGDIDIISNPEFLREGAAVNDFMRPDRVIIGLDNLKNRTLMEALYRPLYLLKAPVVFADLETAEMIKYASNAFLAAKVAFINEIADLCEVAGADIQDVSYSMGLDKRIGNKFLHAGPGFGGSCFPKDTLALQHIAREFGKPSIITEAVVASNDKRKLAMVSKIEEACNNNVLGKEIAILGVAFKPNTDDVRESPSLTIIRKLSQQGAHLRVYDPVAMDNAKILLNNIENINWSNDVYSCVSGANVIIIVTEWNEFRSLDLKLIDSITKPSPDQMKVVMIDLRNIYRLSDMAETNMCYISIGRRSVLLKSDKKQEELTEV